MTKILTDDEISLYYTCEEKAKAIADSPIMNWGMSVEEITELLFKVEQEKIEKDKLSDSKLSYNDEIVEIEELGDMETIDISVSGDNLFYCNDILTKNSFGLPATLDLFLGIISTEELETLGQIMFKQLKNRYNDINTHRRFVVGIDRPKMRLYNVSNAAQTNITASGGSAKQEDIPVADMGRVMGDFEGFKI